MDFDYFNNNKNKNRGLGMMEHTFNSITWKSEEGRYLWI